jgi:hypothetical protein
VPLSVRLEILDPELGEAKAHPRERAVHAEK